MLAVYNTVDSRIVKTDKLEEKGSWINMINPTEEEIALVGKATQIEDYFIKDVL
ncbi:MAG: magnesium transporter CorA family protein, partial [Desulfosporosinus sp.]|nr:magnesium transporter CorA family protein [Desulfosporosinus sp.]